MAKSSRSSATKANNRRKATAVFGPAEEARAERLSAKLLELAKQPKPEVRDSEMKDDGAAEGTTGKSDSDAMNVDGTRLRREKIFKKAIDKRKTKKASIVFQKYSDRVKAKTRRSTRTAA